MIINPSVKSRYVMVKCQPLPTGVNVDQIKTIILNSFPKDIRKPERDKIEFEPGRGLKGILSRRLNDIIIYVTIISLSALLFGDSTFWLFLQPSSGKHNLHKVRDVSR